MRRRYVTEAVLKLMRKLEAEGLSRKDIAETLNLSPGTVTKHLGAERKYTWRRAVNN